MIQSGNMERLQNVRLPISPQWPSRVPVTASPNPGSVVPSMSYSPEPHFLLDMGWDLC
jgi:hypothetical protein